MNIYKTSVVVFFLIALGKLSGFLKDVVLTFFHGVSPVTDAFFLANSISSVLYMAVFLSIPIIVIPYATRNQGSISSEYVEGVSRMFVTYIGISLVFSIFIVLYSSELVGLFSGGVDSITKDRTSHYLIIMSATFIFSAAVGFFNSLQLADKNIIPSYLTPVVNNLIFCIGIVIFNDRDEFYVVLILGVVSWIILMLANIKSVKCKFGFGFIGGSSRADYKALFLIMLPAIFTLYIDQVNSVLSIFFAAKIGDGYVTIMNYGNKLNGVFLSVFLVILTTIIYPKLSEKVSKGDQAGLVGVLSGYINIFIIFGVPVAVVMSGFSEELVSVIFERGAFDHQAVLNVSEVFGVLIFGLVLNVIRDLLNRVLFAYKKTSVVLYLSLTSVLVNFILSYLWFEEFLLVGLAYAGIISLLLNIIILVYVSDRILMISVYKVIGRALVLFSIGSIGGAICFYVMDVFDFDKNIQYISSIAFYSAFIYGMYLMDKQWKKKS